MAARTCPKCNASVPHRSPFCLRCGYTFDAPGRGGGNDPLMVVAFVIMGLMLLAIVVLTVLERLR